MSLTLIFGKQVNFTTSDGRKSHLMPSHGLEKRTFEANAWHLLGSFKYFVFCGFSETVKLFFGKGSEGGRSRNQ